MSREHLRDALADRYRIERELAGGGMSRVYVATEVALGRMVVIKVVREELLEGISTARFAREVQLAASLQQANIVPLLAAGEAAGLPYFTMPYVDGESLRGRLALGGQLPIAECVSIARDVARALSYAHERGIVHRDIKPDNVLLSHGAAMVTDFGIAKAVSASRTRAGAETLTQVGTSIGTPAYMAPEQVAGDPDVGPRADLYAWGCLTYELLAGMAPFVRETPQRVMAAQLTEMPDPIALTRRDVPPALERLVFRCLAKEATDRPASAAEVLRELDAVATPGGLSAPAPPVVAASTPAGSATPLPRGRRFAWAALAVGVALGVTIWLSTRGRTSPVALATSAADPAARSIAVLPLSNLSGDKADDYFGIGLAEEMTRAISRTGVRVIGRASAGALLARGLDERAIAKELGVGSLLTGSVQRGDGQVRINVSLLSASDGAVTWTDRYDRPLANLFAVQDEIAQAVAAQLLGSLGGGRPVQPTRVETNDPEAYALYLQGQVMFGRRTAQTVQQAIDLFERAVGRDPRFARAQAALAIAIASLPYYEHGTGRIVAPRVFAAAQKAIAIDSTVAEAWGAIAAAQMNTFRNREADANYRRAQALDTTVAVLWGWHGLNLIHQGKYDEARGRIARAQAVEPASLIARTWGAQLLMTERRYAAGDSATRSVLAMDSTYALAWDARGEVLSYLGRHDEAIAALEHNLSQLAPNRVHHTEGILAFVYARAGRAADARRTMERMRARNGGELPAMAVLAAAYEALGDHAAAVRMIARAVQQPDAWLQMYNRAERFDALRRDPRADSIMASIER